MASLDKKFVVFEAISFYNAYINLDRINNESGGIRFYIPMVINGAFSIEMSIKAMLVNNDIVYGKEHNLVVLFKLLPEYIQTEIWNWVSQKTAEYADEEKRVSEFVIMSDAFKQWRYAFEDQVPAFDARFLSSFANAAIGVMFKLGYNVQIISDEYSIDDEVDRMIKENRAYFMSKNMEYISNRTR